MESKDVICSPSQPHLYIRLAAFLASTGQMSEAAAKQARGLEIDGSNIHDWPSGSTSISR